MGTTLNDLKHEALLRWEKTGFPMRHERWKYTELMGLAETQFHLPELVPVTQNDSSQALLPLAIENSLQFVFIDGEFAPGISSQIDSKMIYCGSLSKAFELFPEQFAASFDLAKMSVDSIDDLNRSFACNGAVICLPREVKLQQYVHLVYLYTQSPNQMVHTQNTVHLAEGAEATVIEHHIALPERDSNVYFSTLVNNVILEQHAHLNYYRCQEHGINGNHLNRLYLSQAKESVFRLFGFDFKGHLVRNEVEQCFTGENAECYLNGFYYGKGRQHIDNYITIDHRVPRCQSSQHFKGVLDDRSHGVFHGKVKVAKDAQKTNASQKNANLVLSAQVQINTEPQLEIFADDVKCAHGSAIGQLDESALFYLQSRGLDKETAKQILIYSFAAEIFQLIEQSDMRLFWQSYLGHYFPAMPSNVIGLSR